MYTRCDECRTLFRVTREQLNAARGQVRCGRCGNVFDALASLEEELLHGDARNAPGVAPPLHDEPQAEPEFDLSFEVTDEVADEAPIHEAVHDDVHQRATPPLFLPLDTTVRRGSRRWPWAIAAVLLALVLAAQIVHMQREMLATDERFGAYVSMAYDALGVPLEMDPRHDLGAFALLHHELVSHPGSAGALHLSGVLNNTASFAQPWPVLELRLEDRFGEVVAARRLQPDEYLRNAPARDEPMPANARRAIEIEFVDPGHDAVGFSIDFCLELRDGLRCGAQTRP